MNSVTTTVSGTRTLPLEVSEHAVHPISSQLRGRLNDYITLTKPRIAVMALVTVALGYSLGSQGPVVLSALFSSLFGIGLVAASSSILNQYLERDHDRRMFRTASRPLVVGRVQPGEALGLGLFTGVVGTLWLLFQVNALTAGLGLLTLVLYVGVYTPLKRVTSLCTAIGAIPGALPPVLGWTAAGGSLDVGGWSLFALLFLWQFPHFLAIVWLYREQYRLAGLRMLPDVRRPGLVGRMAIPYALVLIPASLIPRVAGLAGDLYFFTALTGGLVYLWATVVFMRNESRLTAKRLIWISLVYLPVVLGMLAFDHWRLLR